MLVVRVEMWSAVTGNRTEIARMTICNDGSDPRYSHGNYEVRVMRGRTGPDLDASMLRVHSGKVQPVKFGNVLAYPRKALHVWNLVKRSLEAAGYK